jgi:phage head maturation protease
MSEMSSSAINDLPDSAFAYIESGGKKDDQGKTVPRSKRHFPIHDAAHVRNALARAPQSPFGDKAMPKIRAAAKKFGIKVTENRSASDAAFDYDPEDETPRAPIEFRNSSVAGVNFAERTITVIAVPYEEEAPVEYRGEMWRERFLRGAFEGIETRTNPVRANRDHDRGRTVGKVTQFWPSRSEGLVAAVWIAETPLGDETLALSDGDCLGASVGYAVRGSDQELNRRSRSRVIKRAFVDHLAFVPDPAYLGAEVLSVRSATQSPLAADLPKLVTPALDELLAWHRSRRH